MKSFSCRYFSKTCVLFFIMMPFVISANICERTPIIQTAIINQLLVQTGKKLDCHEVGVKELSKVKRIKMGGALVETLQSGDLDGLVSLEELDLRENRLESIPEGLENLTHLKRVDLSHNHLKGPLPPGLGKLENLEWLYLFDNELSGPIPASWANLKSLIGLYLGRNQLTGPLPPELSRLENLQYLDLYHNHFSGPLPDPDFDIIHTVIF